MSSVGYMRTIKVPVWSLHATRVDLRDRVGESARLNQLAASISDCRTGTALTFVTVPYSPVVMPVFTAPRGGIRLIHAPHTNER